MDLPLPFTPNITKEFAKCHLPRMTTKQFFEDIVWQGFYAISWYTDGAQFDPEMSGIVFKVNGQDDDRITLSADDGVDNVGKFNLRGSITTMTGKFEMTKRYTELSITWEWRGVLTPFGLIGIWGDNVYGGWVWLWKSSWCDKASFERSMQWKVL